MSIACRFTILIFPIHVYSTEPYCMYTTEFTKVVYSLCPILIITYVHAV